MYVTEPYTLWCIISTELYSQNVGSLYSVQNFISKYIYSPTLRPKGLQKPSNWHIFFLIVGRIYPIQIYILYMWPTTIWKSTNHHLNENLYIGSHNLSSSRLYFRPIHAPPQSDNLLWDSLKKIYGIVWEFFPKWRTLPPTFWESLNKKQRARKLQDAQAEKLTSLQAEKLAC